MKDRRAVVFCFCDYLELMMSSRWLYTTSVKVLISRWNVFIAKRLLNCYSKLSQHIAVRPLALRYSQVWFRSWRLFSHWLQRLSVRLERARKFNLEIFMIDRDRICKPQRPLISIEPERSTTGHDPRIMKIPSQRDLAIGIGYLCAPKPIYSPGCLQPPHPCSGGPLLTWALGHNEHTQAAIGFGGDLWDKYWSSTLCGLDL